MVYRISAHLLVKNKKTPYNSVTNCNTIIRRFLLAREYFIRIGVKTMKKRISQTHIQVKQRMCQLTLTRITRQVSRLLDLK